MSVENFDGDGFADQPSIIYAFEADDSGDVEIRELARSGFGEVGASPGDVLERETTKSDPTDSLPELDLPGQGGLAQTDCGEDIPAFACADDEGCGKPVFVGRTCANPTCERDWAAAVKRKVVTTAGKLEGLRRAIYARYDGRKDIDFNHVVASPPDGFAVDSENPLKRTLLILKTLLEKKWNVDGFVTIFHPFRIKKEYRADQYEHGGAEGEGDMTWKDVLSEDNPYEYLVISPHFHLFFPAVRKSFDYLVAEAVEEETGWLFHRITKGEDSNVSVEDLTDLVHQLTYCYSHAGIRRVGPRDELASRMKGELHNCYIPDGVEDETLVMFCDAAPKLLGVRFANLNDATCDAEISNQETINEDTSPSTTEAACSQDSGQDCECPDRENHPLDDVWNPDSGGQSISGRGGNPWTSNTLDAGAGSGDGAGDDWTGGSSASSSTGTQSDSAVSNVAETSGAETDGPDTESPVVDDPEPCGGSLRPMHSAQTRLEDEEWCQQAEHVSGFRSAVKEWRSITGGDEDHPWVEEPPDDTEEDTYPEVVYDD